MEFEIDEVLIKRITSEEYERAMTEIAELGVIHAYQQSRDRHDDRLRQADDAHTLACKSGCHWCCYFSVDVRPVEVFAILEFVDSHLERAERERIVREVAVNSALLKGMSELERARRNIKCPFLNSGRCAIYEARPQTCRNYHATDVTGCKQSYEDPGNLEIDPDFAPLVYQSGGAHVDAFSKAMRDMGYDIAAYELNTALHAAITNREQARERFEGKQTLFTEKCGSQVPFEFIESD